MLKTTEKHMQVFKKSISASKNTDNTNDTALNASKRSFLLQTGGILGGLTAASASTAFASPAIISGKERIHWRVTSSFPKNLDTIFAVAQDFSDYVKEMTDGKFVIEVFPAGELAPGLGALDVTSRGVTEACHTSSYYYVGKNDAFALGSCIPFGMNMRQQLGWMLESGGGEALQKELYDSYNVHAIVLGNTGAQMGGWLRKEINTPEDVRGLKIRIGGLAGRIFAKLGASPQQIPASDIYPALEKGVIDAAEWVGPYDDFKLGFHKIVKYYYYPGWWEGGPCLHLFVNKKYWNALPKSYQAIVNAAAARATMRMIAKYDRLNPEALRRLASQGAILKRYPDALLEAFRKSALEIYEQLCEENPVFKSLYAKHEEYRKETALWLRYTDAHFDNFMLFQNG